MNRNNRLLPDVLKSAIARTPRGPILIFHGKWQSEYGHLMRKHQAVGIAASFYKNDYETEFEFLKEFPDLQYFASGVAFPIQTGPLYSLTNLRYLRFMNTHEMEFDFTRFGNLEAVEIPWGEGMSSVFRCPGLKRLFLQGYRSKTSARLGNLKSLEALDLRDTSIVEIEALAKLPKLRKLRLLLLPRLTSFAPLGSCNLLEVLHLGKCGKAMDFESIRDLERLKYLILATGKPVESLDFISPLKNLKFFNFDFIVKNGDLSLLQDLPNLAQTVFRRQRHYSHTFQEVQKILTVRGRAMSPNEVRYGNEFGYQIDNWVFED
jgi:Leucine-rich repeat (LRR) protein